jgi:hypothetical protein
MLGATNEALAECFAVSRSTIDRWIAGIPDFRDAVRKGREAADEAVVSTLFTRATGMDRQTTRVLRHDGQPVTVTCAVALPPDVRACLIWLRNRRPEQWRENRPPTNRRPVLDIDAPEEASRSAAAPADRDEADRDEADRDEGAFTNASGGPNA